MGKIEHSDISQVRFLNETNRTPEKYNYNLVALRLSSVQFRSVFEAATCIAN